MNLNAALAEGALPPTRTELLRYFDRHLLGEGTRAAKEKYASSLAWNQLRCWLIDRGADPLLISGKQGTLLVGTTGSGKTTLAGLGARACRVPFYDTSCTAYSSAGFIGLSVEDAVWGLLKVAGGDIESARKGVIFFDELDKIQRRLLQRGDVGGIAVQQALLKILEGTSALVGRYGQEVVVPTESITFVAAGAFSEAPVGCEGESITGLPLDLEGFGQIPAEPFVQYGMLRQLIGRFRQRVALPSPGPEDFRTALLKSDLSPLLLFQNVLKVFGVKLEVDSGWVDSVLHQALQLGTGMRGLAEAVEDDAVKLLGDLHGAERKGERCIKFQKGGKKVDLPEPKDVMCLRPRARRPAPVRAHPSQASPDHDRLQRQTSETGLEGQPPPPVRTIPQPLSPVPASIPEEEAMPWERPPRPVPPSAHRGQRGPVLILAGITVLVGSLFLWHFRDDVRSWLGSSGPTKPASDMPGKPRKYIPELGG